MLSNIDPVVKQETSRWGLTLAAINVGFYLVAYLFARDLFVNFFVTGTLFIVNIVILIVAVRAVKKAKEGFVSFKEAFSVAFLTSLIYSLISTAFVIILFNVIDPQAADEIQEKVIENTVAMAERFGGDVSDIDELIKSLEENNQFGTSTQVRGFFTGLLFSAILALIIAAFMKKDRPIYE